MSEKRNKLITLGFNIFITVVTIFLMIVYFAPLPPEVGVLLNGYEIEDVSGKIIPISESYKIAILAFARTSAVMAAMVTGLAAIFLIGKRNVFEVLGIFIASMLPREKRYWGVVYDGSNRSPIVFAKVAIYEIVNSEKKFLIQAITDIYGRYRIYIPENHTNLLVEVNVPGYVAHTNEIDKDFAKFFSSQFVQDIPLTKLEKGSINNFRKLFIYIRPRFYTVLFSFIFVAPIINIPLGIFFILNNPIIVNYVSLFTTIVASAWNLFVLSERRSFSPGRILDSINSQPIMGALIKIIGGTANYPVITDENGLGKFDLKPGNYMCQIYAAGYELKSTTQNGFIPVRITREGYIQQNIYLNRLSDFEKYRGKTGLSHLMNPFD